MRRTAVLGSLLFAVSAAFACSSSTTSPSDTPNDVTTPDASTKKDAAGGGDPDASTPDSGDDDAAPLKKQTESEPNDAKTATDLDPMDLPGEMTGAIDPAGDTDGFSLKVTPGDLWEWTLTPAADLTPNLVVFDTRKNTLNPVRLVQGAKGATVKLQHYVLRPGDFAAIVRDTRNVDSSGSVGGPTFGYTLTGKKKKLDGVAVTFPATKSGTLGSLSSLDFYTFSGTEGMGFDIVVKAERKASPSTLDSRISLFNLTSKTAIITNDDAKGTTDSEIGGNLPATADYVVVVENEGTDDGDLSYEVTFSLRQ